MSLFVVDAEADGPAPGLFSMVSFGVVRVDEHLQCTFKGKVRPISDSWKPDALAISGITREEHLRYPEPAVTMEAFVRWLEANNKDGRPVFVSDNPAFDWSFLNYYLYAFVGINPFGHSARRINDFYCGLKKDWRAQSKWHGLRVTPHTHDPVDDARGNAEALFAMCREFGVSLPGLKS